MRQAGWLEHKGDFAGAADLRDKWCTEPDALFQVQKQRETGEEPGRMLWFDGGADGSLQFLTKQNEAAKLYLEGV